MSSPVKILYFYTAESSFVDKDIAILSEKFNVLRFCFSVRNKKMIPWTLIRQKLFLLSHIFSSKVFVCQFAGLHSFLPVFYSKLFFKKVVIVAGGTDCVSFPSIRYGNFSNRSNAFFTGFSFKRASLILPVHETLVHYNYTYQDKDHPQQGIKYFVPKLKTRISVIHNGYDSKFWDKGSVKKVDGSFLTVLAYVNSRFTLNLKGIDLFINLARKFPNASFSILGGANLEFADKPANLQLLSNQQGEKLVELFATQQFYVQLSMSEGFPNAVSEAMLCECVPIVSNVGGMPDIVGELGFILKKKDETELFELVQKAMGATNLNELGTKARKKIAENYTFEKRKTKLLEEMEILLKSN